MRNFASFSGEVTAEPLGPVSAVVGRNNAGKSNLFRAVVLLMRFGASGKLNAVEQFAHLWHNGEQDEDVEISVNVALTRGDWDAIPRVNNRPEPPFTGSVTFGAIFSSTRTGIAVRQTGYLASSKDAVQPNLHQAVRRRVLHVPSLRRIDRESTTASPTPLNEPQDGRGLKAWLNQLLAGRSISEQEAASAFRGDLRRIAGFEDIRIDVVAGVGGHLEVLVSEGPGAYRTRLEECGAGLQTVVTVLAALHRVPGGVVLVDDPGSNLHPTAQSTFAQVAAGRARASRGQVVFATHAATVLEAVPFDATFEIVRRGSASDVRRPSAAGTQLWEVLHGLGHRPHHLQLANAILFVEGPSDELAFRAWWRTLFDEDPEPFVALLMLGGSNMAHLRKDAVEALGRPVFCFVDSDRAGDDQPPSDQAREFAERLRDVAHVHVSNRRSIENYLTPEALSSALGKDVMVDLGHYETPDSANIEFSKRTHVERAAGEMPAGAIPKEIVDFLGAVRTRSRTDVR